MGEYGPFNSLDAVVRFWGIIFGTWAISATLCFGLASWKGKNSILWTLLGICFGPIAFIILLIKTRKKQQTE